jgi:hypothetical protein
VRLIDSFGLGNAMRGEDQCSEHFFTYVRLEDRIPADHPLRAIHELVDAALKELSQPFAKLYAREGRPSIPPERLLRALLLQAFYTVRSERQLMEPTASGANRPLSRHGSDAPLACHATLACCAQPRPGSHGPPRRLAGKCPRACRSNGPRAPVVNAI